MNKPNRIAIYYRFNQADSSIATHLKSLIDACIAKEKILVQVYIDRGYSGSHLNRPALQRLIKDAEDGLFDEILILKLSHLTRRMKDLADLMGQFQSMGIHLNSLVDHFDPKGSMSKFFSELLSCFQDYEQQRQAVEEGTC